MAARRALKLLRRLSTDGGDEQEGPNDNTGKIRSRLKLYQDAIPRLQYESDNNGDGESRYYLAECHCNGHGGLPRDKMMALTLLLSFGSKKRSFKIVAGIGMWLPPRILWPKRQCKGHLLVQQGYSTRRQRKPDIETKPSQITF